MSDLLRQQLLAVRGSALATVATIDAILGAIEEHVASPPGAACEHPTEMRIAAARMGHPGGWHCNACGAEGDGG